MNVAMADNSPVHRHRFASRWLFVGCAIVFIFLLIQAATYSGIVERLAEWQFGRFGRYFPTLTLAVLLLVFAGLWMLLARLRRRARKQNVLIESRIRDIRRLASAANFLFVSAGFAGLMGLGALFNYVQQPTMKGQVVAVDLSRGPATLQAGPMRLAGLRAVGPVARHSEDLLLWRTTLYYVPVGSTRLETGEEVRNLFVEIEGPQARNLPRQATGLLRVNALPPEVAQMYVNARYPTARRSAVLFRSAASADRSALVVIGEFMIFAIIAGLFGLWLRRRERTLIKGMES